MSSVLLIAAAMATAAAQEAPNKLPIDVPERASVAFEAEGSGKEILRTVKQMLAGNLSDPTAPPTDKITVKIAGADVDFKLDDLKPLIDQIHALHVVVYPDVPGSDPFATYQKQFARIGMHKVVSAPGGDGILIMRRSERTDQYGIVARHKGSVVVLRSDGAPGLGDFGQFLFEALTHAVQQRHTAHYP